MSVAKVTVSLDQKLVSKVDRLVKSQVFASRSQAIQAAVEEKITRLEKTRLAEECAKLNPSLEQALADEGLTAEVEQWPAY
jgi:metal-responsive CopG/Arc/MetJ family transcriptional regulator